MKCPICEKPITLDGALKHSDCAKQVEADLPHEMHDLEDTIRALGRAADKRDPGAVLTACMYLATHVLEQCGHDAALVKLARGHGSTLMQLCNRMNKARKKGGS